MASLFYIPGNSTLLLLFKAARRRLMAHSENLGALSEDRLVLATEEMNRIADDIRDARGIHDPHEDDATRVTDDSAESEIARRESDGAAAASLLTPKKPQESMRFEKLSSVDLSAEPDGVRWAGEYHLLAFRREKAAFVSLLVRLGYAPEEFRVTVRRVPPSAREDTRIFYSVLVVQTQNGVPDREKRYSGGHDANWVDDFARDAVMSFPCEVPFRPASDLPMTD